MVCSFLILLIGCDVMAIINFPVEQIVADTKKNNAAKLEILAQTILDDSNFYIPRDTSTLLESGHTETVSDEQVNVVWDEPYANYQYQGISKSGKPLNYSKDVNPNAQSHWFEVAKNAKQGWKQLIQRLFG